MSAALAPVLGGVAPVLGGVGAVLGGAADFAEALRPDPQVARLRAEAATSLRGPKWRAKALKKLHAQRLELAGRLDRARGPAKRAALEASLRDLDRFAAEILATRENQEK